MSVIKKCTNCGTENDIIFTNCQFCKSPLPWIDADSIPNDELISNAGKWVGRVGSSYSVTPKNTSSRKGKAFITHESIKIEGFALTYLSLLQERATNDASLKVTYDALKKDFDSKNNPVLLQTGRSKMIVSLVFAAFVITLLYFIIR